MLLKYITFRKIKLFFLLYLSYHLSYFIKKDFRWGRYIALSIEPTNSCNLSCTECPTGTNGLTRQKGNFSTTAFKKLIDQKAKDLIYLNFYFQGEPFLNKNILEMIKLASQKNIYTSTSTNAQLIDKELAKNIVDSGLNRIIISIDGTSQEIYEKYRIGGQLEKVINASKFLIEAKKDSKKNNLKIVFQFLVFKHNEHQIHKIKKLGHDIGIDKVEIKSAQIYNFKNSTNITSITQFSRYKKDSNGFYLIKSKLKHKCWRMWHSGVITQDQNLVPCCFDKDADYTIGNLNSNSISVIERSSLYKKFRQNISSERSSIPMCQNCSEGLNLRKKKLQLRFILSQINGFLICFVFF